MSLLVTSGLCAMAALAVTAAYHSKAPLSQLFGRTYTSGRDPSLLALTYDDGPNDPYTQHLLDVLHHHNARATFFVVGKFVRSAPKLARAIVEAGHSIGNHTYSHPNLALVSPAKLETEIARTNECIYDATGVRPEFFRPPFGSRRPGTFRIVRRLGLVPIMWSVTSSDWKGHAEDVIEDLVVRRMDAAGAKGHVLLLHDGDHLRFGTDRRATVAATKRLLTRFADSRRFVSIPEMMSSDQ